jgi:Domain of unknown function (DUF4384)
MEKIVFACRFLFIVVVSCAANLWVASAEEPESTRSVQIIAVPDETRPSLVDLTSQAENDAGVTLEVLPAPELRIGSAMSIRVGTQRSGYLILLDVDAEGKLTQLFPNRTTLVSSAGNGDAPNALGAGKTMTLPDPTASGVQMIVGPPKGTGMIVAVLSEQPVQLLDLPDVPSQMLGRVDALKYVTDAAHGLRLEPRGKNGRFEELKLSFAAKFYHVQ